VYPPFEQDDDELTFKVGAEILVLPFPDPEDEEEGWLFGYSGGKDGVFPANFTEGAG
jgi:amphiphysin